MDDKKADSNTAQTCKHYKSHKPKKGFINLYSPWNKILKFTTICFWFNLSPVRQCNGHLLNTVKMHPRKWNRNKIIIILFIFSVQDPSHTSNVNVLSNVAIIILGQELFLLGCPQSCSTGSQRLYQREVPAGTFPVCRVRFLWPKLKLQTPSLENTAMKNKRQPF